MKIYSYDENINDVLGDKKLGCKTVSFSVYSNGERTDEKIEVIKDEKGFPLFLGVELEWDTANTLSTQSESDMLIKKILEPHCHLFDFWSFVKRDGSMKNTHGVVTGFEIVSLPATKCEHFKLWSNFLDNFRPTDISINDSTGLHVHVARENLSTLQIGKIVNFINNPQNLEFIKLIAGRDCTKPAPNGKTYAQLKNKKISYAHYPEMGDSYKYLAVNLQKSNTIEFRIFRSTFEKEVLFKALDFCESLVYFCSSAIGVSIQNLNQEEFLKFIIKNKKNYSYLFSFLLKNKVIHGLDVKNGKKVIYIPVVLKNPPKKRKPPKFTINLNNTPTTDFTGAVGLDGLLENELLITEEEAF